MRGKIEGKGGRDKGLEGYGFPSGEMHERARQN